MDDGQDKNITDGLEDSGYRHQQNDHVQEHERTRTWTTDRTRTLRTDKETEDNRHQQQQHDHVQEHGQETEDEQRRLQEYEQEY